MTTYKFKTDAKSKAFCDEIVEDMARRFGISRAEAIGRVNREWKGRSLIGNVLIMYHEPEEYWAQRIYYAESVRWWIDPNPAIKPYP